MPAPAAPRFTTLFADASKDPCGGEWAAVMAAFAINPHNAHGDTDTTSLRNMVAASGEKNQLMAFVLVEGGVARIYTCLSRWDSNIVSPNATLDGKYFAIEGELIGHHGHGHVVEILTTVFNKMNTQVVVPDAAIIVAELAAHPATAVMGPYNAGDEDTTGAKSRKICPVPHDIAGLFAARPGGITWQYFFSTIYPAIQADGNEGAYAPLILVFQMMSVGAPGAAIKCAERPAPFTRSVALTERYLATIQAHFPQLAPGAAAHANTQIAGALGALTTQNQLHFEEQRRVRADKDAKAAKTVKSWLGELKMKDLLHYTSCRDEAHLVADCPAYLRMAQASKANKLSFLQDAVDASLRGSGNQHLQVAIPYAVFHNFWKMDWGRMSPNSAKTGFLGNLFLFGETDEEATATLNSQAETMLSSDRAPTLTDSQAVLRLDINPPVGERCLANFLRMQALADVLLPATHVFRVHLAAHNSNFSHFQHIWSSTTFADPNNTNIRGVLYMQAMSIQYSTYWNRQKHSPGPVAMKDPTHLVDLVIETNETWIPTLSPGIRAQLNIPALLRLGTSLPRPMGIDPRRAAKDDASLITGATSLTSLTGATLGTSITGMQISAPDLRATIRAAIQEEARSAGPGGSLVPGASLKTGNTSTRNANYLGDVFGKYKDRKVNGKVVPCADVRKAIRESRLPQLPDSKAGGGPVCLPWHVKGMCNTGCPRSGDHLLTYSAAECKPLEAWCAVNWPRDE